MSRHCDRSCGSRGIGTVQDTTASALLLHNTRAQITSPSGLGSIRRSSKSTFSLEAILLATRVRGGPPQASMNSEAYWRAAAGQRLTSAAAGIARTYARDRLSDAKNSARAGEGGRGRQSAGTSTWTKASGPPELRLGTEISTARLPCAHENRNA